MAFYRIEIHLKSGKLFRVVREVSQTLDVYYFEIKNKARKEYGDNLVSFDLVQVSRFAPEVAPLMIIQPPQEDVYNNYLGEAFRAGIKHRDKGGKNDALLEERMKARNQSNTKPDGQK